MPTPEAPSTATVPSRTVAGWAPHAALLIVQMAFAGGAVEGKLAMRATATGGGGVDPFALAMARMLGAAVFFQLLARLRPSRPPALREHARIALLSLLGIVLNQTLFLVGLRITTAFAAALLGATIPVFTAGLAVLLRVERPATRTAVGLALAFSGVLWLTGVGSLDLGALLIALNCLSYALYIVLAKPVLQRLGARTLVTWVFTWGVLMMVPVGGWRLAADLPQWGPRAWLLVGFMIACPTIIAYLANAWALQRSTPTMVTIYIYLQPLLAALLQWVQMREPVSRRALVASALILAGVAVVTSRRLPRQAG
jgi:drug/metabolite transporter (DMT)-like permease